MHIKEIQIDGFPQSNYLFNNTQISRIKVYVGNSNVENSLLLDLIENYFEPIAQQRAYLNAIANIKIKTTGAFNMHRLTLGLIEPNNSLRKLLHAFGRAVSTVNRSILIEQINDIFDASNVIAVIHFNRLVFRGLINHKIQNAYQLPTLLKQVLIVLLTVYLQQHQNTLLLLDNIDVIGDITVRSKLLIAVKKLNTNVQVITTTGELANNNKYYLTQNKDCFQSDKQFETYKQ